MLLSPGHTDSVLIRTTLTLEFPRTSNVIIKEMIVPRRIFQLATFILVAIWVLQYLGGVALHPKEVCQLL